MRQFQTNVAWVWSTTSIVTCRVIGDDQVTERLILCSEDGLPAAELGRDQGKSSAIGQWQGFIEFIQVKVGQFTGKDFVSYRSTNRFS
jgi:hypothetical protein